MKKRREREKTGKESPAEGKRRRCKEKMGNRKRSGEKVEEKRKRKRRKGE